VGRARDSAPSSDSIIMTPSRYGSRLHGLDAIRGIALCLGVVLHGTMSFFPGPTIWVVGDLRRSATLSVTFYVIHALRMATFFLIAGYFARMMHQRLGSRRFVRDRLTRIALPLILCWPISLGAIIAIATAQSTGKANASPPPLSVENFPLTHLWFLYLLLWLYATVLVVRCTVAATDRDGRARALVDRSMRALLEPWGVLLLSLPVALALYSHPYWLGWFGVPTPDMSLIPNRAALVTYGAAFAIGWLMQRQADLLLPRLERWWGWHLALALMATAACLALIGPTPVLFPMAFGPGKARYALLYAIAVWSWTFALLGIGLRFFSSNSPVRRYLADASYWIYLMHLPVVMAMQLLVSKWALPWSVKLPVIVSATMALLLLTYRLFVRTTVIGALLNGRRHPRTATVHPSH
jgi:glucans biosynthesis protein C